MLPNGRMHILLLPGAGLSSLGPDTHPAPRSRRGSPGRFCCMSPAAERWQQRASEAAYCHATPNITCTHAPGPASMIHNPKPEAVVNTKTNFSRNLHSHSPATGRFEVPRSTRPRRATRAPIEPILLKFLAPDAHWAMGRRFDVLQRCPAAPLPRRAPFLTSTACDASVCGSPLRPLD